MPEQDIISSRKLQTKEAPCGVFSLFTYVFVYFLVVKALRNYTCFRQVGLCVRRLPSSEMPRPVTLLIKLTTLRAWNCWQKFRVSKQKVYTTYEVSVLSVSLIELFLFISLAIILRLTEIAAAVYVDIFHALFGVGLSRLLLRQLIVLLYRLLMTGNWMWSVGTWLLAGKNRRRHK